MKKLIFTTVVMTAFSLYLILGIAVRNQQKKVVDFPEEFPIAEKGDLLKVEKVTNDTIFLGFHNKNNNLKN